MSKVIRGVKNVTKGYSSVQVKVRNATSNDPWGPTGTEMSEIAQMTFNNSTDFYEIMDMLDKRLNDKGKNWRHVLKSLKVLDYCLHEGSELVVTWARNNIFIVKTLREFQHIDEDGRDVGQNVRISAKELTALIQDEERLRKERLDRKSWKSRVTGIEEYGPHGYGDRPSSSSAAATRRAEGRNRRREEEDAEYRLAIEASKYEAEEDRKRREKVTNVGDDEDLAKAIKLSKEEEELRRKELEESNAASLFDDAAAASTQPQFTGYNQGYQQQGAVDWFGNPVDAQPQQTQSTGFLNQAYSQPTGFGSQPTGFQTQPTGYQNGFSNGFQPQATGFDQSQFQQQTPSQPFGQANALQPQTTAFLSNMNNPYAQQSNGTGFGAQAQPQQQQQQLSTGFAQQSGSNNPWATDQQQQIDALKPLPTGSNNPFASSFSRPQPHNTLTAPSLNTLHEQKAQTQFGNFGNNQPTSFSTPSSPPPQLQQQQQQQQQQKLQNPQHAHLNALLASGEGQDTFGNTGNLRIPAQHTAPGTFVNSAGQGLDRLHATQTGGNNPFFSQQFTGMPQQTGFGQTSQAPMIPAQTGPAGMGFGGSPFGSAAPNNNPYGQRQPQQGSLIDF